MISEEKQLWLEEYKELALEVRQFATEVYQTNRLMLPTLVIGLLVLYGEVEKFVGVEIKNIEAVHRLVWCGCLTISLIWISNVSRLAQRVYLHRDTIRQHERKLGLIGHGKIVGVDQRSFVLRILGHGNLRLIGFGIYFSLILYFPLKSINSYEMLIPRVTIIGSGVLSIWIWYFYFKQPFRTSSKTPIRWQHIVSIILLLIPLALPFLGKVTRTSIHGMVGWVVIEAIVAGLLIWIWYFYFKKHTPLTSKTPIKWYHIALIIILLTLIIGPLTFFLANLQTQPDANAHLMRGLKHYANGEYDKAIDAYTKAIKIKPDDASAYVLRAESHRANKQNGLSDDDWVKANELRKAQ